MDLQIVRIGKRTSNGRDKLGSNERGRKRGEGGEFRVGGVGMRGPGK